MKYQNSEGQEQPFRIRKIGKDIKKKKTLPKSTWYD